MPRTSRWHAKRSMAAAMATDDDRAIAEQLEYEAAIAARIDAESTVAAAVGSELSGVTVTPAHPPYGPRRPSGVA